MIKLNNFFPLSISSSYNISIYFKYTPTLSLCACLYCGIGGIVRTFLSHGQQFGEKIEIYYRRQMTLVAFSLPLPLLSQPFPSLTKSFVNSKSHQLSQRPPDSIQASRDRLHARNIHADPDKPAPESDKSLNQPVKLKKSESANNMLVEAEEQIVLHCSLFKEDSCFFFFLAK